MIAHAFGRGGNNLISTFDWWPYSVRPSLARASLSKLEHERSS